MQVSNKIMQKHNRLFLGKSPINLYIIYNLNLLKVFCHKTETTYNPKHELKLTYFYKKQSHGGIKRYNFLVGSINGIDVKMVNLRIGSSNFTRRES